MPTPKIVLITLDYPPERGGIARYLGSLVTESHEAIEVIVESHHDATGPGVIRNRVLFRNAWPRWLPMVRVCRTQKDVTLLVSHVFPVGTAALISRLSGGPPYAVLFHGLDLRRASGAWKRWLLRRIVRRADALIVNSHATERELKRIVPDARPLVLTPGVRKPSADIVPVPKTRPRVISIARLVSRKGLDVAIRAMGRIQRGTDVEYVVIGDGPDLRRLKDIAAASGALVRWISMSSDEDKWSWLASSDAFLLPVRDEGNDVEGFGIVFLEAGAVGVPCVAGRSGGADEAVVDGVTGILVDPRSVDETETAVRRLLNDETLRRVMGENARQRTEVDFQWRDRWKRLDSHLRSGPPPSGPNEVGLTNHATTQPRNGDGTISVVIPCFNHAKILRRTLRALSHQTLKAAEVIVIDDASTDDPSRIVKEFNGKLPIRFAQFDKNRGAPAARNEGFRMTASPLVMFLDADAELVPNALETFAAALKEHPDSDLAYSNFHWGLKPITSRTWDPAALRQRNFIHTSSLIQRSAFPGFDESLTKFQDWDLWLTMAEKESRGVWIDAFLYRIEPRRDGISSWLPKFAHRVPWPMFGWMPKEIRKYREAERIIREKHRLADPSTRVARSG